MLWLAFMFMVTTETVALWVKFMFMVTVAAIFDKEGMIGRKYQTYMLWRVSLYLNNELFLCEVAVWQHACWKIANCSMTE